MNVFDRACNWALLAGYGLCDARPWAAKQLAGVRANLESFPTAITGLVMSGFSVVFDQRHRDPATDPQSRPCPRLAAFAATASAAILVHAVFVEPITWFALRFITGICMSGVYIIAESWLNASTNNDNRGRLLSVYMVVQLMFWASGQLLLIWLILWVSTVLSSSRVLVSMAVVPLLLSSVAAPVLPNPKRFGIKDLYRISPLGCIGMVVVGSKPGRIFQHGCSVRPEYRYESC